jgi:hypothetical protein
MAKAAVSLRGEQLCAENGPSFRLRQSGPCHQAGVMISGGSSGGYREEEVMADGLVEIATGDTLLTYGLSTTHNLNV